jgi:hypothetical protein
MLTAIHTLISFVAIGTGIVAIAGLFRSEATEPWTAVFLITAVLTTATGFLFPFLGPTPAFLVGIVAGAVLLVLLLARYAFHLRGWWRAVYAAAMVISLYFLVFVLIAQALQKLPPLNALAPTGSEPPFTIAQLICLAAFAWIGYRAVRHARMMATAA